MASVRLAECAPHPAPSHIYSNSVDFSITEVSFVLHDLSWTTDGSQNELHKDLENEVMVDPWSSMDSTNSPLTDSGPSASDECIPSTSSEPAKIIEDVSSPLSPDTHCSDGLRDSKINTTKHFLSQTKDKVSHRDLTLDFKILEPDPHSRRPHFLDEDYQSTSNSNIECQIPKPHFLDHSPSPDELDERSDITNPNFLDDEVDADDNQTHMKSGALPKRPQKLSTFSNQDERPRKTVYRSTLPYGLESAARSSERDKRASQLYRGTWSGERDVWPTQDTSSVRSFSSNGSAECSRPSSNLENKMECVCSLISLLSLSPENNADLSGPLLDMSRSVESCIAMRQAGCIPLLVQLIHSKVPRETRDRAAKALRNIIHTHADDKSGRREARVWRLLEQVREYCYILEDVVENKKEGKEIVEDDATKHPSQSVAALMKLSFDEEHRHVVCQLGGLQALAALVSGDQAAHGSRTDDNTCLTMRKYAGMTLTNLTFGDGNNKSLLCSFKDFMLALVDQLESPNDDMRQVTAAVLRNLSWRADTNSKQVLREVGAVKGLTKAAMTCQKEATLKSVLSALWNLTAHCSMNKVALCSVDGALGFLVDMLSYNSPTKTLAIVENAGGIMRNVSSHIAVREDYRQILRERNCLSVLLQHLKSPSLTVVSNSCGTLWNLSARCPEDQQFLWDHGAVPMLRSLIHSKHKMIAMGSSAALKNLLNSKPGKSHILTLDTTARNMNLPPLPTLGARKQKALEHELDQNLAETCDNIEPATSPSTSNREEKNLFTATERAISLERHRMTSSSPLMGTLSSQISLSHSAHLASYLSCSNTLLKGALGSRSTAGGSAGNVNRSDSKDSVTSTHSDTVFERVARTGKVPVPTPRNRDLMKMEPVKEAFKVPSKPYSKDGTFHRYSIQPPIPPPRTSTDLRTNYTDSGYDVDQDSCDQPIDFSRKYSETKTIEVQPQTCPKKKETKKYPKKESSAFGDYQETDLDQPTDYSLRYAEHQSENDSDTSEPKAPAVHEDTIKHFATEGTPYETPIIFSTATSMSDLRVIGKDKSKPPSVKENPEIMTHSDEKDTCSIEDPPRPDNDRAITTPKPTTVTESNSGNRIFDTKFSSGMISPEKPVNYCEEGTPGYFSRVSSLSSLGEPTEEDSLAKKNAMATINMQPNTELSSESIARDKEGSKAVTFANDPVTTSQPETPGIVSARTSSPQRFIEDTPLMFSRSSSLGSLPECEQPDDQGSVISEVSRLTSGCISPSDIPDSPGHSVPISPRGRHPLHETLTEPSSPPSEQRLTGGVGVGSVFEERVHRFVVEHTPAQLSGATSLSSLTIDDEPRQSHRVSAKSVARILPNTAAIGNQEETSLQERNSEQIKAPAGPAKSSVVSGQDDGGGDVGGGVTSAGEECCVYVTEDTPALLSKFGSRSDLSALSLESPPAPDRASIFDRSNIESPPALQSPHNRASNSDSSNLSDSGDLLEECIQKGIAKVVKNKGPPSDVSSVGPYSSRDRDEFYRSLPPYLRSSTETVKMSHEYSSGHDRSSRAPPLPPRGGAAVPPPPPPRHSTHGPDLAVRALTNLQRGSERPKSAAAGDTNRYDSLSSLSLDSFGSTDREIFEQTVKAGLHRTRRSPRTVKTTTERSTNIHQRRHRSLDTSRRREQIQLQRSGSLSSLSNDSFGSTDKEVFERCVRRGMRTERSPKNHKRGALDRMRGPDSAARVLLEQVIARAATKNVHTSSALARIAGDGPVRDIHIDTHTSITTETNMLTDDKLLDISNSKDVHNLTRSNEQLAPPSTNTTLDSTHDLLNLSNESCAEVLNDSFGDALSINKPLDTWGDSCLDDVTFPTLTDVLPDLLERSGCDGSLSRPDLTCKLDEKILDTCVNNTNVRNSISCETENHLLDAKIMEIAYTKSLETSCIDSELKDLMISSAIEMEAARLAAQLKSSSCAENAVAFGLDDVDPPSDLGSLLSLTASGQWEDSSPTSIQNQKSQRSRKKSLPVTSMVKRALSNSYHREASEDISFLDNMKPPSEFENVDMESSMISVSSIVSEVVENTQKTPIVFDLKQPIQDFPFCSGFGTVYHDLDGVNPPSLFDEMAESTLEIEQTTVQLIYEEHTSNTLNVTTDIQSGSENCSPLPSDISSVDSTPKRHGNPKYLTPKEKRNQTKNRYKTYTITDSVSENDLVMELETDEFLTWTKSESDRSGDYNITTVSDTKTKKRISAKQRRLEDRARYQTQTVDIQNIFSHHSHQTSDPHITSKNHQLNVKKSIKQKRIQDAERFRTRTLSEDIPPSPTFVTKDANFENVETTTGYDSLSSNELNHQQLSDDRQKEDDVSSRADSGHNEDDFELNSTQMQTYTKSFRNYLPVIESPTAVDMCVVNNLKNIEMTASYKRSVLNQSTSDVISLEDINSGDKLRLESDEYPLTRPKPKITKPEARDESLDSNHSCKQEPETPKAIRGKKKAMYVSPYRRTTPIARKPVIVPNKVNTKVNQPPKTNLTPTKSYLSAKSCKSTGASKNTSANTSPKKSCTYKQPMQIFQKPLTIPLLTAKPLPLERQGTFTKEESSVANKNVFAPDKKIIPQTTKAMSPTKLNVSTSPSRLPQYNRYGRAPLHKTNSSESKLPAKVAKKVSEPVIKNSPSTHSLQSNDSVKTVTLASKSSKNGSTTSINSIQIKTNTKDVESKIASLWKKVEQNKKQSIKPDKRVWIESDKIETAKLIRSSTFEGRPKQSQIPGPKQKSAIGIRVSQIPSLKPKTVQTKQTNIPFTKKPNNTGRVFSRKLVKGDVNS